MKTAILRESLLLTTFLPITWTKIYRKNIPLQGQKEDSAYSLDDKVKIQRDLSSDENKVTGVK